MGAFPMALSIASAAFKVIGGIQSYNQAQEQAKAARRQAEDRARERIRKAERLQGRQTARFLKSGVLLRGTPLLILEETEQDARADVAEIDRQSRSQQRQLKAKGRSQLLGSFGSAAGTLGGSGIFADNDDTAADMLDEDMRRPPGETQLLPL